MAGRQACPPTCPYGIEGLLCCPACPSSMPGSRHRIRRSPCPLSGSTALPNRCLPPRGSSLSVAPPSSAPPMPTMSKSGMVAGGEAQSTSCPSVLPQSPEVSWVAGRSEAGRQAVVGSLPGCPGPAWEAFFLPGAWHMSASSPCLPACPKFEPSWHNTGQLGVGMSHREGNFPPSPKLGHRCFIQEG